MIHINYTKTGTAFSDDSVESVILEKYKMTVGNTQEVQINVSTCNMVNAVRSMIVDGVIPFEKVKIYYNDEQIIMDGNVTQSADDRHNVGISNWPEGFCDHTTNWLNNIMGI